MSGKVPPLAAFCEEYDEDSHESLPQTRQVANRLSLQKSSPSSSNQKGHPTQSSPDGSSDSGYSSRTFASSQSALSSGAKSPPLTVDSTSSSTKTTPPLSLSLSPPLSSSSSTTTVPTSSTAVVQQKKSKSSRKDSHRRRRSTRDDPTIMQVGSYPSGPYHGSSNRSPSRSRGAPYGAGWDYDSSLYHPSTGSSTPIEPLDYSYYLPSEFGPPGPPPPPPMPPSSQTSRYSMSGPPPGSLDPLIVPHSSRPSGRSGRANTYQSGTRPLSFHGGSTGGGAGGGFYNPAQLGRYDYGPPLSASAYSHSPSFGPSAFGPQPPFYSLDYGPQMPPEQPQPQPQHFRDRSMSRSREYPKARRGSMYGPPLVDNDPPTPTYDDGEPLERGYSRDSRPPPMSPTSSTYDHNEDYYRMPPPPIKHKSTSNTPHIIQKQPQKRPEARKMATTTAVPHHEHRRGSKSFDMTDMDLALPDQPRSRGPRYQRSRENLVPERSRSLRNSRRASYRDPSTLPSRLAVEGARRRRATFYHDDYEDEEDDDDDDGDDDDDDDVDDEIEEKQREAEQYQAAKIARNTSSNKTTPLTEHALQRAKNSRAGSDSGSLKSHSNSSRGSDARTHSGSNAVSSSANTVARQQQQEEERKKNITMIMNGITMSFDQESVGDKKISLRTGDTGALELNIGGGKKPKKYLTSGSEYAGTVARREIEDPRRPRDGRRSEKASRRSSRSTYSGRFLT